MIHVHYTPTDQIQSIIAHGCVLTNVLELKHMEDIVE